MTGSHPDSLAARTRSQQMQQCLWQTIQDECTAMQAETRRLQELHDRTMERLSYVRTELNSSLFVRPPAQQADLTPVPDAPLGRSPTVPMPPQTPGQSLLHHLTQPSLTRPWPFRTSPMMVALRPAPPPQRQLVDGQSLAPELHCGASRPLATRPGSRRLQPSSWLQAPARPPTPQRMRGHTQKANPPGRPWSAEIPFMQPAGTHGGARQADLAAECGRSAVTMATPTVPDTIGSAASVVRGGRVGLRPNSQRVMGVRRMPRS
jgi:hypothetical protein